MPIFGITASSNMTTKLTDFYQIATTTLTGNQLQIDFSSIPQDYTHLQLRAFVRNSEATTDSETTFRFNDDSSANYSVHYLRGYGAGVDSSATANRTKGRAGYNTGSTTLASSFGVWTMDILDYTNTNKYKTTRTLCGYDNNGTNYSGCFLISSNWRSTAAVTKISLTGDNQAGRNFVQYSRFDLYGVKA
jgi:hypothetical protein